MKNVLVTGGAGFIGSNFIRFLLERDAGVKIINLDLLTYAGSMQNLVNLPDPDRHIFVKGDICDREVVSELLRQNHVDTIIHFAAETHVDRSITGPEKFVQTNVMGTFSLLEAARDYWLVERARSLDEVRFHHISTDEVYGTLAQDDPAWTEATSYAPKSPYSASKAASDHLVRAYGHTYGLPYSITNCSNNYGPYQFPEKLIPLIILNAQQGKPLPIYGDGLQIRDWLYVEDHCEAVWLVITQGKPGETYNVGGGSQPTNLLIVNQLCSIMDETNPDSMYVPHSSLITYVADRPGHDRRYAIDIGKINRDLGWQPRHTLGKGLEDTVRWYLDHPEWVEAVEKQSDYQAWLAQNYEARMDNSP